MPLRMVKRFKVIIAVSITWADDALTDLEEANSVNSEIGTMGKREPQGLRRLGETRRSQELGE